MKKTFRSILAGALALLAVSCYDDSALRNALASLESRVAELETKLNTEVGTLNSKFDGLEVAYKLADQNLTASIQSLTSALDALDGTVDGLISSKTDILAAIEDLKTADKNLADKDTEILASLIGIGVSNVAKNEAGNVVLTFVDGSTLEVPTKPQEGLVTVVEVDGESYWAVVVNGEKQSLGVKVGHPSLEFEVDYDTKELLYSVDGGEFEGTGAYVADDQEYLLTDFYQDMVGMNYDTWEPIMSDYFVLVFGGVEYQLPVYKVDESVVTIKAGKTYFTYGESKTIDVVVSDITSMYVMTKPDGWKAKLNGNKLTITAPSEANVVAEIAEAEGEVLLHCSTKEGKCKVAKLAVSTTEGFKITVNADGSFTLVNPYATVEVDELYGETYGEFNECIIGLATVSEFEKDPATYVNEIMEGAAHWEDIAFYVSNWKMNSMNWETGEYTIGGAYEAGVYEVDVINSTVADVYNYYTYGQLPRGSQFIVWATPVNAQNGEPMVDELVFGYYTPLEVVIEPSEEVTFNSVSASLALYGAEKFYVGHVAKNLCFNYNTEQYDLAEYLKMYISYLQYGVNYIGKEFAPGEYEVEVSELIHEMEEAADLLPDTEYFVFALPIISGKAASEYSFADVIYTDCKTSALVAGGDIAVEFDEIEESYTQIAAGMTATDALMIYYNWYTADQVNELTAEELAADLLANGYINASEYYHANKTVNPGESYVLAALAVDAEGVYGAVAKKTLTGKELVYSTTFVATAGEPVFTEYTQYGQTNYKVTVPVTVEGGEAAKYYYYWNTSARTEEQLQKLPLGTKGYYYYLNSTSVPKDLVFYKSSTSYQYAVVVESTTGELSAPVIITVNNPDAE